MKSDKNSTQTGNLILVVVAMVMGVLIGLMFSNQGGDASVSVLQGKMDEVMQLVEDEYVDAIDADSLSEHLVAVMLSELDPHSSYLSARETEHADEMMRGTFEGVGLMLHREGDTTYVGHVLADGPSSGLGLLPGDMILTVDGERVSGVGMVPDSVVARLRGPRHSTVGLSVLRQGRNGLADTLVFRIRRGVVPHHTLPYFGMIDDTTGYLLLTSFASTSHDEFRQALRSLTASGMRHLVFDLRGNSGGSLSSATGIAGELLPSGSVIVYTEGEHSRRHYVRARRGGLYTTGRVTVLIDESSASASEVVSGALQDNDRALLAGRRTFGKGLVQTEFSLGDGSSVLLTTARYYTPSGRCIQRTYEDGTDAYYRTYVQQLIDESYADSAQVADTTPYHTAGGRVVYGGGGITPDIILPYRKDSTFVYFNRLSSKGLVNRVAFDYVKGHASELAQRYASVDDFCRRFHVADALIDELVARGERAGVPCDRASLRAQRRLMANMMKAYIGQSLFGDSAFYRICLQEDEDLHKILHP